ncbi:MAG: Holliday junction resolvase RuvX [Alphaproteobacteria bacterium]|nr:Holliday junction resolvase RuvX [Alphaproteobacteria bacterium]MBP7763435.1 Holliday junction resolvase RuvX [Alphaproteobacteria bacterium]MBP7905623.1 Holliday junction resolvase RuvX [Alphaproteobacteria bacterium]
MTVSLLKTLVKEFPTACPLLGLDVGKKTIGVAVCDDSQRIATPVETIKRTKFSQDLKALERIVKDFEAGGFIVGLPLNMDGSEGRSAQSVRDFALELERQISKELFPDGTVWIALVDERLSTDAVDDLVGRSVDKKKTRDRAKKDGLTDKLAAMTILQEALDTLFRLRRG